MLHPHRLLARVVAPASEPITLAEAKLYLRVDTTSEDALISDLIVSSRMDAESYLRRSLITQSWKIGFDSYDRNTASLPMGPVIAISEVLIRNQDDTTAVIDEDAYYLNSAKNELVFATLITSFALEITYSAGYGDASSVPKPIKLGMLAHIAAMYDGRGEAVMPQQSLSLYAFYRELSL